MEKKLLITLSDKNSINDSKRLFTNIQSKKLWKFELMLLAYKIPKKELNWFTDRGIKIKRCDKPSFIPSNFNPVKSNKFLLFEKEFKKWNNIVYLDSDIIIKSNINELGYVKEFSAVQDDLINGSLIDQLIHPKLMSKNKLKQFRKKFSFLSPAFNSGVMAFPTTIINKDTIKNLKKIINEYADIKKPLPTDQPILNLLFYKKWKKLPIYYNLDMRDFIFLGPKRLNKGIFHFVENSKECLKNPAFIKEWGLEFNKDSQSYKYHSKTQIWKYCTIIKIRYYTRIKNIINMIDKLKGVGGTYLFILNKKLYSLFKK